MKKYLTLVLKPKNFFNLIRFIVMIKNPLIIPFSILFPKERILVFSFNGTKVKLFYRNVHDLSIIFEMFVTGAYPSGYVCNSKSALDVGAHAGYFAVWCCTLNDNIVVYSFEPDINNYNLLLKNINFNSLSGRVHTYNFGLGNSNTESVFYKYDNDAFNSTYKRDDVEPVGETKINIHSVKDELKGFDVDLLKVDIEGSEDDVVYGYLELNKKPKYICVEFSDNTHRDYMAAIRRFVELDDYNHEVINIIVNSRRKI